MKRCAGSLAVEGSRTAWRVRSRKRSTPNVYKRKNDARRNRVAPARGGPELRQQQHFLEPLVHVWASRSSDDAVVHDNSLIVQVGLNRKGLLQIRTHRAA